MTKQATVELLKQQLPGFYSAEQVINIINDIEDSSAELNEDQLESIADTIYDEVRDALGKMYTNDIIDTDSAEFSLYDKTIELDSVDIDKDTYNLSVKSIERILTKKNKLRIKAIIPVHLYGQMADMSEILAIADLDAFADRFRT